MVASFLFWQQTIGYQLNTGPATKTTASESGVKVWCCRFTLLCWLLLMLPSLSALRIDVMERNCHAEGGGARKRRPREWVGSRGRRRGSSQVKSEGEGLESRASQARAFGPLASRCIAHIGLPPPPLCPGIPASEFATFTRVPQVSSGWLSRVPTLESQNFRCRPRAWHKAHSAAQIEVSSLAAIGGTRHSRIVALRLQW